MDMLLAIRVFAMVAERGSFVRASKRLGIATSVASRRVAELEQHLGVRLLNRTTRRLSLTESGDAFYERSVQLIAALTDAEQAAQASATTPRGTIRLTSAIHFGMSRLAPAIAAFLDRHPQVSFNVSLSDHMVDLVEEGFDLAVRVGEADNTNLIARKLTETRLIVCASPAYLAARGTPKTPEDLSNHNCFSYAYVPRGRMWSFRDKTGKTRVAGGSGNLSANNASLLVEIAAHGAGVAVAPDFIVEAGLASGRLTPILQDFTATTSVIYAVYSSRRHLPAKVRAFVSFLVEYFAHEA